MTNENAVAMESLVLEKLVVHFANAIGEHKTGFETQHQPQLVSELADVEFQLRTAAASLHYLGVRYLEA